MIQNNLGNAYQTLPTGDRGENLDRAIACYEAALTVYSAEAWPERNGLVAANLGAVRTRLENPEAPA
ncbi:MAG: hypothetical protein AABZ30_13435 [Myxococcota bacterium]